MKKIKVVLATLVFSAFALSCGSDDENPLGGDLTAKWNQTKTVTRISGVNTTDNYTGNDPNCEKDYLEFKDNGDVIFAVWNENADGDCQESFASDLTEYQKTGNTLIIGGTNASYSGEYQIARLTGSELQIKKTSNAGGGTEITTTIY